jgi:hypothetical protein
MSNRAGVWYTVQIDRDDGFREFCRPVLMKYTAEEIKAEYEKQESEHHTYTIRPVIAIDEKGDPFYRQELPHE